MVITLTVKAVSKTGDTDIMKILSFSYVSKNKTSVKLQFHSLSLQKLNIIASVH